MMLQKDIFLTNELYNKFRMFILKEQEKPFHLWHIIQTLPVHNITHIQFRLTIRVQQVNFDSLFDLNKSFFHGQLWFEQCTQNDWTLLITHVSTKMAIFHSLFSQRITLAKDSKHLSNNPAPILFFVEKQKVQPLLIHRL